MRQFSFTAEDLQTIASDRYGHPHPHAQRKMEVLWLKSHDLPHEQLAALAGVSLRTVGRYLNEYFEGGLAPLRRCHWRGPTSALAEHEQSLEAYFWDHPPQTAKQAAAVLAEQTGIQRGLTQVRAFLKYSLGLSFRKVAAIPVPPKLTIEEHARVQAEFLEKKLQPRLREARAGLRTVYFVDAAPFVWAPFLGSLWCLARWFVRSATGRRRYNVLGALNAVSHEMIRVTNEGYVNAQSVCTLLRTVAAARVGVPLTLVLDNAKYQRCELVQSLASSLHLELLFLPSYSPNLNLIERVWRFVRKRSLNSTYHASFEQFQGAIDNCLENLGTKHKKDVATLLVHKFQTFENVPILAA